MSETTDQMALFEFVARFQDRIPDLAWLFHPANGEKRDKATAGKLKSMGVRAGVPDVWLPVTRYDPARNVVRNGVVIELKCGANKETPEQRAWLGFLQRQGWEAHICYEWTHAARILVTYLGCDPKEFGL